MVKVFNPDLNTPVPFRDFYFLQVVENVIQRVDECLKFIQEAHSALPG